jgi:hypothetical protein
MSIPPAGLYPAGGGEARRNEEPGKAREMLEEKVLGEIACRIEEGGRLSLLDEQGREVLVVRRGAAAPGRFRVRRRGATAYVTFEFFGRRTGMVESLYIGTIQGVSK